MPTPQDDPRVIDVDILETGPDVIEITEQPTQRRYYFDVRVRVPAGSHPAALAMALLRNVSVVSRLSEDAELRFTSHDDGTRGNEAPVLRLVFPDEQAADADEFASHRAT